MRRLPLLLLTLAFSLGASQLRDESGRVLVLHGANVDGDAKSHPLRMPSVDAAGAERMARDWGFNLARFLVFWDALEPAPGVFDEAYLARVAERLDGFQAAGVFVVLDMHQDVYSRVFCCDGAPPWAVRDDGIPFVRREPWFVNYFEPAVIRAFDNFWDATGAHADLQAHYAAAWQRIAERLGPHPAVLGYDLMNEPSPGTGARDEVAFDQGPYLAFLERMITAVRAVDTERWIFFEPRAFGVNWGAPSHLPLPADPRPGEPRLAYFPHLYSITVDLTGVYDPTRDPSLAQWEARRSAETAAYGVPLLIGEFGHVDGVANAAAYLGGILELADRVTSGWAYWEYNDDGFGFLHPDGSEKREKLDLLVRAYPQRVAGTLNGYGWEPETRRFWLEFEPDVAVDAPTEVYVPAERFFPEGFVVEVEGRAFPSDALPTVDATPCDARRAARARPPCGPATWQGVGGGAGGAGRPRLAWDPEREVVRLWVAPRAPVRVTVRPR